MKDQKNNRQCDGELTRNQKHSKQRKSKRSSYSDSKSKRERGSAGKPEATQNLETQEIKYNDPAWYLNGPAGPLPFTVPFSEPVGEDIVLKNERDNYKVTTVYSGAYSMPAILAMEFAPTYGEMKSLSDPINMSLTRLHTMLRYGQSYSHTYDAAHLGVHMIMADQLFMLIAHLRRCYGLLRWYSSVNKHVPEVYVRALGFDCASLNKEHMEDFRQYINMLVRKVAMIKVPANWKLFLRHQFMCETIYMDSPSIKSQMYGFVPGFFYKYVVSDQGNWSLAPVYWSAWNTARNLDSIISYCDEIVNSYIFEEDATIISADMLRIYGNDGCYKLYEIDPNYTTQPVFDPTILAQIHNATVFGPSLTAANVKPLLAITQDTQKGNLKNTAAIECTGATAYTSAGCLYTRIMDAPIDGCDANYVAEASRLMAIASASFGDGGTTYFFSNCGTEFITSALVWYQNQGTAASANAYVGATNTTEDLLTKFNHAPLYYRTTGSVNADVVTLNCSGVFGTIDNYAYIGDKMLRNMHLNAHYSLFDVPVLESAKITYGK